MTSAPKPSPVRPDAKGNARLRLSLVAAVTGLAISGALGAPAFARDLFKQDAFSTYKADLKNGEYMMNAAGCASCHAPGDDLKLLSGGLKMDTFIGTFYVPNITAHPNGTGGWSNADYLNAVMNGVGKDGRHLYPVMPYTAYAGMKPEDVLDIKAYVDSLPQSDAKAQAHELSFPYNLSATIAFWKRSNFTTEAFTPGKTGQLERGKYLVESVGGCGECHTPRTLDFGLDKSRAYEGEKGLTGAVAPDITQARIGSVSQDAFVKSFLTEGNKLSGTPIADPIMRKFAAGLANLSDEDKTAIYAYLKGREVEAPKVAVAAADACKDETASTKLISAGSTANLAAAADEFIGKFCRNCHGPGESAQGSYPAGDLASIATNAAFVTPGDRNRSILYTSVASGRMPYGRKPSGAEVESLGAWIDSLNEEQTAAAASSSNFKPARQRPVLPWRSFAQAAVTDIGDLNASDRPFIRYFSYRQQFNGKLPCEDEKAFGRRMALYKAGFHKLLNSVSLGTSLVVPETVEGTKDLLVRVDIRDLGWDDAKWDKLVAKYPLGYDAKSDSVLESLSSQTDTELPIMRIDWFMANAGKPANYHALLDLGKNISELEKRMNVDVNDNIKRRRVLRAAFMEGSSGVSDHNRMLERHDLPQGGYYWKSYDMASSRGKADLKRHPHGPEDIAPLDEGLESFVHDGGEMIFSLPNGLQGYYLSTNKGEQLERGPTEIVSFRQRPIGKGIDIINGRSCFSCHENGIIAKRDQMREHIEKSPTFSIAQRDLLLEMYVEQRELDDAYNKDRAKFVAALEKIGATEPAQDGGLKSVSGPGGEEIITWFADSYEEDVDHEALAAEFDMTTEEFEAGIARIDDLQSLKLAQEWLITVKGGGRVPRFEVEAQFPKLVKAMLGVDPLDTSKEEGASSNADASAVPESKDCKLRDDCQGADAGKGKLELAVKIDSSDVTVGDKMSFSVTANKTCELQVLYVESTGNVELFPQEIIGEKNLEAGKARVIPDPAAGEITFDEEGKAESLVLICAEGGLGDKRLSAEQAKKLAEENASKEGGAARGIAIKVLENARKDEKAADAAAGGDAKTGGAGTSAIQFFTFNVTAK